MNKEDIEKLNTIKKTLEKSTKYFGYKEYDILEFDDFPTDYNDDLIEAIRLINELKENNEN